jgi:hypothetical protein
MGFFARATAYPDSWRIQPRGGGTAWPRGRARWLRSAAATRLQLLLAAAASCPPTRPTIIFADGGFHETYDRAA